ncbi:hypothetical protein MW887_005130 [Aspergillus wentii]|nr:hypothetical protein MW887_005130 [Aspergillus wentii]
MPSTTMASEAPEPQSLKSWQDSFQYPIPTVRRVEQELRRDIASNKERLRALVGTRYRELVGTAETIVSMNHEIQETESNLTDVGRRCNPRLVERKHAHYNQIKRDEAEKDADKRAFGAQLSLLHRCTASISKLLRKRSSLLLIAKILVISRLLHKTLTQQETVPPFLESLRNQLAHLRQTLSKRINKRLASMNSTADDIIEALAAYCLATSSSSDDAIRHFHQVRLDVIGNQLELTDLSGGNVLKTLRLYIRTLQTSKVLLSRRLSDALGKLKARPLLTDPEIRNVDDLGIDVLGRWVAPAVNNFTPWIKLSELTKSDAEKIIKQWSNQAFQSLVKSCQKSLASWHDFYDLLSLRKKTLEIWLSSWSSTPTHSSLSVLEGIRSIFNGQLTRVLSEEAKKLEVFGKDISSIISSWDSKEHADTESLWDPGLISLDYSNGAATFKQAIVDRLLGQDEDISTVLKKYRIWASAIQGARESIEDLKRARWVDIIDDGEDEDPDVDITATLSEDDPHLLREALQVATRQAFDDLQSSFSVTFEAFGNSNQNAKAAFLLRLIRLVRRNLPAEFISDDFTFSGGIVPKLQEMIATEVVAHTTPLRLLTNSQNKVQGRTLWEGIPELPVQPSASTFKYIRRLVSSMEKSGADLWDPSTVQVLKKLLQKAMSTSFASAHDRLESSIKSEQKDKQTEETKASEDDADDSTEQSEASAEQSKTTGEQPEANADYIQDWKIQLFFDAIYLKNVLVAKDLEQKELDEVVERLRGSLGSKAPVMAKTMEKAAQEYWGRTRLLFGLLAVGVE